MSVTNAGVSRTQDREVLGSTWLAETVGDPFGFDVSMFRTPSEQDRRRAQPIPCPESKGADRRIDWDENFRDAVAPYTASRAPDGSFQPLWC